MRQVKERLPQNSTKSLAKSAAALSPADMASISNQRDASMAQMLAAVRKKLRPEDKVLVICGSLHGGRQTAHRQRARWLPFGHRSRQLSCKTN